MPHGLGAARVNPQATRVNPQKAPFERRPPRCARAAPGDADCRMDRDRAGGKPRLWSRSANAAVAQRRKLSSYCGQGHSLRIGQ